MDFYYIRTYSIQKMLAKYVIKIINIEKNTSMSNFFISSLIAQAHAIAMPVVKNQRAGFLTTGTLIVPQVVVSLSFASIGDGSIPFPFTSKSSI